MQQIHNLYYDQCSTGFGRYSPIVRSAGTVCAAFGVMNYEFVASRWFYMWPSYLTMHGPVSIKRVILVS
jgi:hypothetical protein